jgi:hypothetical protein
VSVNLEEDFLRHLLDIDSLEVIARQGISPDVLPTADIRPLYLYALNYYYQSGKVSAVSKEALETYEVSVARSFVDVLVDLEIDIFADPDLEINDVIEKLQGQYVLVQTQAFNRHFALLMSEAPVSERLEIASTEVTSLLGMIAKLTPHRHGITALQGAVDQFAQYSSRAGGKGAVGMRLGVSEIDHHLDYIQPGEVVILGAAPKVGKSIFSIISALAEWRAGRTVALYTLENSIEMTLDRLICSATTIDSTKWQRGQCSINELEHVERFIEQLSKSSASIHILHPKRGQRSVEYMLRQAQVLDADSIIIDQLSHVEHPDPRHKSRWEIVRDIMQDLKVAASTSAVRFPVLLFHQMSREGKKAADKRGYYLAEDLAESSEAERSADAVCTMYQSRDMRTANQIVFQIVAARRVDVASWVLNWHPAMGHADVRHITHV